MLSKNVFKNLELEQCDGVSAYLEPNSKTLLVTFGGIRGRFGMPIFEFFNLTSEFDIKKIYLRDLSQVWYQSGIEGISQNIDETVNYLRVLFSQQQANKIVMIGNSAGGYAALLFGYLLGVDEVHAFSPQTFLTRQLRIRHFDFRWFLEIQKLHLTKRSGDKYLDLLSVFHEKDIKTVLNIHYCYNHRLDEVHAVRMSSYPKITLHKYDSGGHALVKLLRDNGNLKQILEDSLKTS